MGGRVERVRLDDGTVVWARVRADDGDAPDGGGGGYDGDGHSHDGYGHESYGYDGYDADRFQDTGVGERVVDIAGGLAGTVGGVVRSLRAGLDTTAPVEVAVTFGIELTARSGKVVSAIAEGGGKSSLSVSLTWTEPAAQGGAPDPEGDGGDGAEAGSAGADVV
jgi:hypothetical protein